MAREDVNIKVSANVAEAIQMWKAMEAGPEGMARSLESMGHRGRASTKSMGDEITGLVGKWTSVTAAITATTQALRAYFNASQKIRDESVDATKSIDTASRQYFISSGIKPDTEQGKQALDRVLKVAQETGTDPAKAFAAARLLAEFGATHDDQQGDALTELLDLQDAADISGKVDGKELTRAVLTVLQRSGKDRDAKGIRELGAAAVQLTGSGAGFNVEKLGEYSQVAKVATDAGIDMDDGLALWAALREQKEMKPAKSEFSTLFDREEKPGEIERRNELIRRARELQQTRGLSYDETLEVTGDSMQEKSDKADVRYKVSGYQPDALDRNDVRKQLIAALREEYGKSPTGEVIADWQYRLNEWLVGPERAVEMMYPKSGHLTQEGQQRSDRIRERALGRQEFTVNVNLRTDQGITIPTETEAVYIQDR